MALGFGFNKVKVLASAEKYVQAGKFQNAINEYEKVVKEDPKDLTVLNTIGDLCSRIGKNEHAVVYFKKVGEAYATAGFTVKAIAMYKKLTKLSPHSFESIQRLAELYTVQGLYNDARAQYVLVAESQLKAGNNDDAAKSFQKILELDPDNAAMQTKLAGLYIKLGKKTEARAIYFTAAQSLYAKQSMEAADDALARVLSLDPKNVDALLLRGAIAAESGDGAGAVTYLKDIPDVDSRPDALRSLLRAQIQLKNMEEAKPIASKLATVHSDLTGITWFAEAMIEQGKFAEGLQTYEQFADQILPGSGQGFLKALNSTIGKVKESPAALESLRNLFRKAGDASHDAELKELLAHAYVENGELAKARDLYKELADAEPENPLHSQNYKQVMAKLGEDSVDKPLTAEQGAQAFMMEEFDQKSASVIKQEYPNEIAQAVQAALTDSELFDSYNLPVKAIPPLEFGLTQAPRDFQINLRLATLYAKVERWKDAARAATVVKELYAEFEQPQQAQQYAELANSYLQRAPVGGKADEAAASSVSILSLPHEAPAPASPPAQESTVSGFGFEVQANSPRIGEFSMDPAPPAPAAAHASPVQEQSAGPAAHEINMDEWESMLSVEGSPAPAEIAAAAPPSVEETLAAPVQAESSLDLTSTSEVAGEASVAEFSFDRAPEATMSSPSAPTIELNAPASPPIAAAPPHVATSAAAPTSVPSAAQMSPPPVSVAKAKAAAPADEEDILGDLVSDLEDALGDFDFGKPAAGPKAPSSPLAASAKASASAHAAVPAPVDPETVPAGFSSMGREIPTATPQIAKHEADSALADMFSEFKEDAEESAGQAEDPDTHYNLGIAFKEMGLLDEAIGELQKVCHAIEHGSQFTQVMQAYTWLAQCLVDKGVPQAAVRWYEKALKVNGIDEESRRAVYYDLACAYELAGNQKKAYETFMEVYSSNIDYRDVAARIKTLKV